MQGAAKSDQETGMIVEPKGVIFYNVQEERLVLRDSRIAALSALFVAYQVRQAIETQRMKSWWAPLTKRYLEYKKRKGLSINIWQATGYLKDAIKAYWSGSKNAYVVGIDPSDVHPGPRMWFIEYKPSRKRRPRRWLVSPKEGWYTLNIAKTLEFGSRSRQIPARPLFRRIAMEFKAVAETVDIL